ncbi:annexin D5-like [Pyrus ussuriensis x Pyrus communis]|uniref:Annexin D5-like n=1 Tax=Pyrus ussuriensis x Pyrus communis TaxID=2448454 RepID=A0A5N5FY55_9ROSA|nr:annexin D5-like [Pyrus ussuriensis x Pyrus communis]
MAAKARRRWHRLLFSFLAWTKSMNEKHRFRKSEHESSTLNLLSPSKDCSFRASNDISLSFLCFLSPLLNHVFGFVFCCLLFFYGCVFGFHLCVRFLCPSLLLAAFLFFMACLLPNVALLWLLPAVEASTSGCYRYSFGAILVDDGGCVAAEPFADAVEASSVIIGEVSTGGSDCRSHRVRRSGDVA